ncbi:MAG: Lrp/AsnC family transcriptional regulator [Rhodospirillales bacterium]|jgi:Lrp/AsnC family transcriptional regulator|nr:Lrp/AsnC family transcriptional regulator [Rhodospirillales bacterium]
MDDFDRKILTLIQEDDSLSVADVADQIGLSTTPCWRRIHNLEKNGVIRKRVALLDTKSLNVGITVLVTIRAARHNTQWLEDFSRVVDDIPEIVEIYRMSGDNDYLMKVVAPSIEGYDVIYRRLIDEIEVSDITSSFAMETIKYTTALPLDYI